MVYQGYLVNGDKIILSEQIKWKRTSQGILENRKWSSLWKQLRRPAKMVCMSIDQPHAALWLLNLIVGVTEYEPEWNETDAWIIGCKKWRWSMIKMIALWAKLDCTCLLTALPPFGRVLNVQQKMIEYAAKIFLQHLTLSSKTFQSPFACSHS